MNLKLFARENGTFGIRNRIAVLSTVACANHVAELIANSCELADAYTHPYGCDQLGPDLVLSFDMLYKMGIHPNVGAVVVVGLGCEEIDAKTLGEKISESGKPVLSLVIQEVGGTTKTKETGATFCKEMAAKLICQPRVDAPFSALTVGLECGGSDYTSGIASNPAIGVACGMIIREGAKAVFGETTELMGAEDILDELCELPETAEFIRNKILKVEQIALDMKVDLRGSQPSPGNIDGGLTTIEEKSLGGICKAGKEPIVDGLEFGQSVTKPGLSFMDTPGNDLAASLGICAGGAQVILFSTGRGTPMGFAAAPMIKITANQHVATVMSENIDVDLTSIIQGQISVEQGGQLLFDHLIRVCQGEEVVAEKLGHREFSLYRISPILT
ncbi:UxaA family hydrolase [Fusibacter ferrireducens]|uniref:UxaA family hydrolase n=1 Tax=Fusibacter ferrireducens TaxID=2785058 RepID=A0ABR9ZVD0_9FIRM|nr:UxaA family hydrolase [Fusibacter ferrireducens]MBF4693946.1 UxaA family hydrolase [Fusibacter ferrireducens]